MTETTKDRRLATNTSALFLLQIATYVLPLILLPYYAQTFGDHTFGTVSVALSAVALAWILTDFGFSLSATELISRHREDSRLVEESVGAILIWKVALVLAASSGVALVPHVQSEYADDAALFYLCALPIAGQAFQPLWFFQGMERMRWVTVYSVSAKASYLVLALAFIRGPGDYLRVPVALGVAQLAAAALGFWLMARQGYRPRWPSPAHFRQVVAGSYGFFASRLAAGAYTSGSTFVLGMVAAPAQVASFAIAEQLYRAGQGLFFPLTQALYPYMVRERDLGLFKKVMAGAWIIALCGVGVGYLIAPWVLDLLFGAEDFSALPILHIFIAVFVINIPAMLLGYPLLGAFQLTHYANRSVLLGCAVFVVVVLSFDITTIDPTRMAYSILAAEASVLLVRLALAYSCTRRHALS